MRRVGKLGILSAVTALFVLLTSTFAIADVVSVTDVDVDTGTQAKSRTIAEGGSATVTYTFTPTGPRDDPADPASGCNNPSGVSLSVPEGVTADPPSWDQAGCESKAVSFTSDIEGEYTISIDTISGGKTGSAWNTAPATFTLIVQAATPADETAPVVTVPSDFSVEALSGDGGLATFTATAEDETDGTLTPSCSPASGETFALGTTTVSCSATDAAGNTGSDSFVITVIDSTAPVVTVPANRIVEATGPGGATSTFSASASDAVDGSITPTCTPSSGSTFPLGSTTVSCSATDAAGNTGSASFNVTVVDTTAPVVTGPADINGVEATSAGGAAVNYSGASASDAVSGSLTPTCVPASGSTFPIGTSTVVCSATDAAGNTGYHDFDITVSDTTAPVVTAPADITDVEATGPDGAVVTYSGATATDTVDGSLTPTCLPASGSTFDLGTTVVTCTATDTRGNTGQDTFTIEVVDTTAPSVTVPANIAGVEATGPGGAVVSYSGESANDIVDGALAADCSPASGSTFAVGTTTVTCSATDAAGNTGTNSFTITVVDTTPPAVTVPANIAGVEATGPGGAVVSYSGESANDIVDGALAAGCLPASGSTFALGTTTVTCSATDAAGNTGTNSFTITVVDTTPPAVTVPANITGVEATGPDGATVTFSASADDVVDGALAPTCTPASGSTFSLGTTVVSCSATDDAGNTGSASFDVTVVDTTAPTLSLPDNRIVEATGPDGALVSFSATANDIVDGAVTPICAPASGSTFALGTTTVSCSATDDSGNAANGSFTVTVQDTTAPTIVGASSGINVLASGASGAVVTYGTPGASDVVDPSPTVVCSPASGSTFAPGSTTVTCTATDAAGNSSQHSFQVVVSFDHRGFFAPVDRGIHNTVKNGATVPLKWNVLASGGGYIRDLSIVSFRAVGIACDTGAPTDDIEQTSTGGTTLRYDTTAEQYIQNWQTPKRPGTCWRATVTLSGGQTITADFRLK